MHVSDQKQLMELLVYWFSGVGGVSMLREFMKENPIYELDDEGQVPQPGD
jgi:hypothetical protein